MFYRRKILNTAKSVRLELLNLPPNGARFFSRSSRASKAITSRTRNIGIIAHIDAGKTTTTERMLYYSGYTTRIGNVDEGSTVTDFLPAERTRGITIQSAAITLHWPPAKSSSTATSSGTNFPFSATTHDINLVDTPGHADFTFEVLRSLRVLDGAVCILDGVAGVEAQTEIVWSQAGKHAIPRLIYVNKLDRDGAAFGKTVQEIALKLHVWPAVCHVPKWKGREKQFCGIGDAINLRILEWEDGSDGRAISVQDLGQARKSNPEFAAEVEKARIALVELLSEHDDLLVENFLACDENHLAIPSQVILESLRRCTISKPQRVAPVFAGASFKNIGVQPLMDSVVDLLPSPEESPDPYISIAGSNATLKAYVSGELQIQLASENKNKVSSKSAVRALANLEACAIAFKVVNDFKRGVLVYVRVYHGRLRQGSPMFNTTLGVSERASRILRMYASDAVDIEAIEAGHIGVVIGLKHTRTGDTLICTTGTNTKTGPPSPMNSLQLKPIPVPPPVFFTSIEPERLSEEKAVTSALEVLLREDPSLHVSIDTETGQTHLSGMGELHLEIAGNRLVQDLKAKATVGKIEIGYRESPLTPSEQTLATVDKELGGKIVRANSLASIEPRSLDDAGEQKKEQTTIFALQDNNMLSVHHPTLDADGRPVTPDDASLPSDLSMKSILVALRAGATAALARGPMYGLPLHSTHVHIHLRPQEQLFSDTTTGAVAMAARQAIKAALRSSSQLMDLALLEPVMHVTITVHEKDLGDVVHDITSARGGQVLSLGEDDDSTSAAQATTNDHQENGIVDIRKVYAPPDPFVSAVTDTEMNNASQIRRNIIARVPLKEMVGYLKHLRSLTGGRGTFIMQVDRFEAVRGQRLKRTISEIRGM